MASAPNRRPGRHPGRTLLLFLALLAALYSLLVVFSFTAAEGAHGVWQPHLGLDLQGGTRITLQATASQGKLDSGKISQARNIIDQRVNATGVSEAEVTTQGGNQIIIEIPGQKKGNIVDEVGRTAQLRFRLLWASSRSATTALRPKQIAKARQQIDGVDWSKLTLQQMLAAETERTQSLPQNYQGPVAALRQLASGFVCAQKNLPQDDLASHPLVSCDLKTGEVMVLSPAVIEGTQIASANAVIPDRSFQWVVALALKGQGKSDFSTITEALYQQELQGAQERSRFAIVLDGEVLSAPTTNGHFSDGKSQISGGFTQQTAQTLANQLKYGALPLTFEVNGVSVEGPSLAGAQLSAGLAAGIIGLTLVTLYLLAYYRGLGLVAIGSLLMAGTLTYALVLLLGRGMGFTLTLPGIAGLIVAIGITADSFIVYFERIRDEVREGRTLRPAIEAGWARAKHTILAADAVSFLAALVLFIFAIGVVRGFAFALGLTTLIDVFVVFFFTKPLVSILARRKFFGQGHRLSGLDASHLLGERS